jgi:hypothetical protein
MGIAVSLMAKTNDHLIGLKRHLKEPQYMVAKVTKYNHIY